MTYPLQAKNREEVGKRVCKLRQEGMIPAVIYGGGREAKNLSVEYKPFEKLHRQAGESSLIDLFINGEKPIKVIIQDIQLDAVSGKYLHLDLRQVKMDEKIETEIALEFINEAPAVKELGGTLVKNMDALKVKCLPGDLVSEIKVDISSLKTFDNIIAIKDISIPSGIEVLEDLNFIAAMIAPPRLEEEKTEVKIEEAGEEKKPEEPVQEEKVK